MDRVVATLPLSPRQNAGIGFYSIPLLADVIASFAGISAVHTLNTLGAKGATVQDVALHFGTLERLGISSSLQWRDSDEPWGAVLARIFTSGFARGWVVQDERTVMVCPCGKVEFLANTATLAEIHGARKVYEMRDGKAFCLLCGGVATPRDVPCLLVRLPHQAPLVRVVPVYAATEWDQLIQDLAGRELLVTRSRETGIHAMFMGKQYNVDIDFAWKLFPERLHAKGLHCSCLVVGHKTMKHALSIALIASLLEVPGPEFVVSTPYLSLDFGGRPAKSAEELITSHGGTPLRWMLGMALGCTRKELTLQSKLIHLIEHSIGIESGAEIPNSGFLSADEVWHGFNAQRIQSVLAQLRRRSFHSLTSGELHLASILGAISPLTNK